MRRNAPFGDIPDDKTKYWILQDKVFLRPDQKIINDYSESVANIFEPREKYKVTERSQRVKNDSSSSKETAKAGGRG